MTQDEVEDFLKANPNRWFTTKDVSEALKITKKNAGINLKKLLKRGEIPLEKGDGVLKDHVNYHRKGFFWRYNEDE